jgi:hypothetical protein
MLEVCQRLEVREIPEVIYVREPKIRQVRTPHEFRKKLDLSTPTYVQMPKAGHLRQIDIAGEGKLAPNTSQAF